MAHKKSKKSALQILGIASEESSLIVKDSENSGMQIDLLIDRADDVVNVCEIKFYKSAFAVTPQYAEKLLSRIAALEETNRKKTFHLTYPQKNILSISSEKFSNEYADVFQSALTVEEFFT